MPLYSPGQIRAAFGLQAVKLHAWHNTYGLTAGVHQPNGHRRYSLADAAMVGIVANMEGELGFMQHRPAVALANAVRDHAIAVLAQYAGAGADMLVKMGEDRPGVVCTRRNNAWAIQSYANDREQGEALARAGGFSFIVIDFMSLFQTAAVALSRPGAANV